LLLAPVLLLLGPQFLFLRAQNDAHSSLNVQAEARRILRHHVCGDTDQGKNENKKTCMQILQTRGSFRRDIRFGDNGCPVEWKSSLKTADYYNLWTAQSQRRYEPAAG